MTEVPDPHLSELTAAAREAEDEGILRLEAALTLAALREAEREVLGRRSPLSALNTLIGRLAPEARREAGAVLNAARQRLEKGAASLAESLEAAEAGSRVEAERIDLTEVACGPSVPPLAEFRRGVGHLNLVTQTRDELEDTFVAMGFAVAEGPEAETDWYNFEALNMPPAHPAVACGTPCT